MATYGVSTYGVDVYGSLLISSVVPSYLGLRINFSVAVHDDAELRNPDNYSFTVLSAPAVGLYALSVTPESGGSPTYVDIECTDLTDGESYQVTIAGGVIQNVTMTAYFPSSSDSYIGVSTNPTVSSITATSSTEMMVIFSKTMAVNSELLDTTKYTFTNGLTVRSVESVSPGVVKLTTSKQIPSRLYTLTVSV